MATSASTSAALRRRFENAAEDDINMLAIAAPEAGVDAKDDRFVGVEAESETVVLLEILEAQIGPAVGHLAGVVEERAVEAAPDFPAVLRLREHRVRSAEAVLAEAAQRVVAAQRRHRIER